MSTCIFVLYDSIYNSVFASQVLSFIESTLKTTNSKGLLVTFETTTITPEVLSQLIPQHLNLDVIVCKKVPFIGRPSLWYATWQLKKILQQHQGYSLIARGPLAGFICLKAKNKQCDFLKIQARGLLAEEYGYTHHQEKNYLKRLLYALRKRQFLALEQEVYACNGYTIEAVSPALKDYLITTFASNAEHISIAQHDIPVQIDQSTKKVWRAATRKELNVSPDKHVYCYNGSLKPWQCPQETLQFFKEQLKKNNNSFLLMLTQDVQQAENLIAIYQLPQNTYAIRSVKHADMYRYLAACDTGIVLRQPHIINWVSRPTKILEYQAVDLKIIHNNTIDYLNN